LQDNCAVNLGGGFHHAFPDHGEGFCAINDVAVAIRRLQSDGALETAMVVDLDVHHGNGTAAIFAADPSVFTLSMHQENNYPHPKPPSDLDVGLDDFTGDDTYLRLLTQALDEAFVRFAKDASKRVITPHPAAPATGNESPEKPALLWYLAGADPYKEDQLGGLALTLDGLIERDRIVIQAAKERGIPLAITFAGGYAQHVQDTVQIHVNTIVATREALEGKTLGRD
jgi:acetoin utilization deacetylase AcuC-like enzyme